MTPTHHVIRFKRIEFDQNWTLTGALPPATQIFSYIVKLAKPAKQGTGTVTIYYELPQGKVQTIIITCRVETKAFVHRDVIHFFGAIEKID